MQSILIHAYQLKILTVLKYALAVHHTGSLYTNNASNCLLFNFLLQLAKNCPNKQEGNVLNTSHIKFVSQTSCHAIKKPLWHMYIAQKHIYNKMLTIHNLEFSRILYTRTRKLCMIHTFVLTGCISC